MASGTFTGRCVINVMSSLSASGASNRDIKCPEILKLYHEIEREGFPGKKSRCI